MSAPALVAPPPPPEPRCLQCGAATVQIAYSEISGRWWVLCQVDGCRHYAPVTDGRAR